MPADVTRLYMDSDNIFKIGLLVSLLLVTSCIGWFDNDKLYEIPLNSSVSIVYFAENDSLKDDYFDIYYISNYNKGSKKKNQRIKISNDYLKDKERLEQRCTEVIYNDTLILILNGINDSDSPLYEYNKYYKYHIINTSDKENIINKEIISNKEFDFLVQSCKNCDYFDVQKIRKMK